MFNEGANRVQLVITGTNKTHVKKLIQTLADD